MKRIFLWAPVLLLLLVHAAAPQSGSSGTSKATTSSSETGAQAAVQTDSKTAAAEPLAPIAWMKGGTWVAEIRDKQGAVETRIENRIRGSENGHLIKFITTFIEHNKPAVHYEGIYAYDPAKKQIGFWYTSSEGEFTSGYVAAAGKTFTHDFNISHANGAIDTLRSVIVRDGDDAYQWNVMSHKTGQWAEIFHLRYVRERESQ